jgi:RHS repeat-associated protein
MNPSRPQFYVLAAASLLVASVVVGAADSKDRSSSNAQGSPGREIVSLRTSDSRTFSAPEGKRVAVIYEEPVNYRDGKTWRAIDNRLVPASEHGSGYANHANRYSLRVPSNAGSKAVRIANEDDWLDLELEGAHGHPSIEGNTATYDVSRGLTVTYTAESSGIEAELTLENARVPDAYRFTVKTSKGLSLKNKDGAIVALDSNDKVRFSLPTPWAIDNAGEIATGTEISLKRQSSRYIISIQIDRDWLRAKERSFPVKVDQTVDIEQSAAENIAVGRPTTDCLIQDGFLKNVSLCAVPILGTGSLHGNLRRSLLRFDIAGSLPQGASVVGARLGLYQWRHQGKKNVSIDLHLVSRPFTNAATWKRYDTGHLWTTAGGDFVESALASTEIDSESGFAWWYISDAAALQAVADGSSENDGFLLKQQNERTNAAHSFLASEYWNTTLRPHLEITYEQQENLEVPQAPELPKTGITPFVDQTSFLYIGSNPVQTGVASGTIDPVHAAVIRGKVTTREGDPLSGVTVTVLDHPEYGQTKSRIDGSIYMAVNGGGPLTVVLEKEGYLEAQRQVDVPWQDYVWIDDVVLAPLDSQMTEIDSGSGAIQVARGNPVTDTDGTRQGTLIFQPGTAATMTMPDGSNRALDRANVRITEYTVGDSGPEAMPAELPPSSAYTYAAEFSVDEALSAGASEVTFDKPVISYTENFVGFDVGNPVPVGYYDRAKGQWVAEKNGRVIAVLSITDGLADLDVNGSGVAATASELEALGITDEERRELAVLYQPGQSLWRVPVTHFTPYDYNWPVQQNRNPSPDKTWTNGPDDCSCSSPGCEISVENQSLGESAQIAGTPFKLDYQNERTPGRIWVVNIPLTGSAIASDIKRVDLRVSIAGTELEKTFAVESNKTYSFTWDGKDAFGRTLIGGQNANISVGYVYDTDYSAPSGSERSFALQGSGDSAQPMRVEMTNWAEKQATIRTWDARAAGLGGWTLDINHTYDATSRTLFGGDGSQRSIAANPVAALQESLVVGGKDPSAPGDGGPARKAFLSYPMATKVAPDGAIYVVDEGADRIRRIGRDGIITTFAGNRLADDGLGDDGPAADAWLSQPDDIALGPDGSVYVSDSGNGRIRRITPDGIITTVAGGDEGDACADDTGLGDGGPATAVALCYPRSLAVAPDGSIYFAEGTLLRRIGTDGTLSTIANGGSSGGGSTEFASQSASVETASADDFGSVGSIAVSRDGTIYFIAGGDTVRKITPDGTMTTLAGHHEPGGGGGEMLMSSNRALAATESDLGAEIRPRAIALAANGSLLIAEESDVLRLDATGTVTRVPTGDLSDVKGIACAPNGDIYLTGIGGYLSNYGYYGYVKLLGPPLPGFSNGDITVASEDGQSLDVFDKTGHHLRTIDALTGADIYRFSYDAASRLSAVTDGNGDITQIERSSDGSPSAIVGPFGQRSTLQVDDNGYLAQVVNPAGESINVQTSASGLLQSFTDANGGTNHFTFDAYGLLIGDENAAGESQTFARSETSLGGHSVIRATPLGRETTYSVAPLDGGGVKRTVTSPTSISTQMNVKADGSRTLIAPDGTIARTSLSPNPRFGMQAPIADSGAITTSGGASLQATGSYDITQIDPTNSFGDQLTSELSLAGQTWTSTWDGASKSFGATTPEGRTIRTDVDAQRRPISEQMSGIESIDSVYDSHGRLVERTQGSRTWHFAYDDAGNFASVTNPLNQVESYSYDLVGRVTKQTLPDRQTIDYAYDANGNLTSITPSGRQASTFTYDTVNQPLTLTQPNAGDGLTQTSYSWDKDGDLTGITRPDGSTIDYGYDSAGRAESVNSSDGQTIFTYDSTSGKVTSATGPGGESLSFGYDGPLPLSETLSGPVAGRVNWDYDSLFRLSSTSVNGSSVSYEYDNDGLLTKAGALSLDLSPDNGLIESLNVGNTSTAYEYTGYGERSKASSTFSGQSLLDLAYSYDDLGRISTKTEQTADGTDNFAYRYDANGRLVEVKRGGQLVESYGYDSNGNRTSATRSDGITLSATYDVQDRLKSFGSNTYSYSKNGDLTSVTDNSSADTTSYGYNSLGDLKQVATPDGKQIKYLNDPLGRRIGKKVDGQLVQGFLYGDNLGPEAELSSDGSVKSRFVYGTSAVTPDYMVKDGTTYRIVSDERGSPRLVVNSETGEIAQELDFDSYGRIVKDTSPGFQPFGFAGGLYDSDTGLTHFGARDYDAEMGRFISQDPTDFSGRDTNLYAYAWGDPVNCVDPTGLFWGTVADVATGALHIGLDIAAVPPYALYYSSYYAARGINSLGSHFGSPGRITSHALALPLTSLEATGLAGDVVIDWIKGHTVADESICDEGLRGYINPLHAYLPKRLKGPVVYLPGIHTGGKIDFEW